MLRLATVGTSQITEQFLSAVRKTGRFELATCYSRNSSTAEAFAKKHGFLSFTTDIKAVAESECIDAVYIASPNAFHYAQSKLFLENGKHVLCEKPIVTEKKQYDELLSLADKKGLVYMEAIMSRHCKGRQVLIDAIGKIGKISMARIDFCKYSQRYETAVHREHTNAFDMSLGTGTLMDLGVYCVYAAIDLFGVPGEIKASASYLDNGADKSGAAIFEYDGFTAALTYSKAGESMIDSEIIGDRGTVKVGLISQYGDISLVRDGKEIKLFEMPSRDDIMGDEAQKFADYIEHPAEFARDFCEVSRLTRDVHSTMDMIKQKAGIEYSLADVVL